MEMRHLHFVVAERRGARAELDAGFLDVMADRGSHPLADPSLRLFDAR
jgi:hypothetical protein